MKYAFQLVLATGAIFAATAGSDAQDEPNSNFSKTNVFTFAPAPSKLTKIPRDDIDKVLNASGTPTLRPNTATELYLWVLNPTEDEKKVIVELKGAKGSIATATKATIPGKMWVPIKLPKAAPPAAPPTTPAAAPPAVPVAAPAPIAPPEPPPPGGELTPDGGETKLALRLLLDEKGTEFKDDDGKPYGKEVPITLLAPSDYIETPVGTITPEKSITKVKMVVAQKTKFPAPGIATIQLQFPPQEALKGAFVRDGFYRRSLTFSPSDPAPSVTLTGSIENPGENARIYVGVDGIDRAFAYTLNPLGKTANTQLIRQDKPAVRIALAPGAAGKTVTQPIGTFPVLIEVDNPTAKDTLELRLRPAGAEKEITDTIKIGPSRDVRVWLDTSGPTDGGLLFTTRSRDWIKPIDLAQLRGKVEVLAVLRTQAGEVISQPPLQLTVDATPPELIGFLPIPAKVEKGKPLTVGASVFDPETDVVKAVFFLCKQLDEGKIPADAIKAVGTQSEKDPKVWLADLQIPAEFRGEGLVGVVFSNQAGLTNDTPKVQRIEIVDARPPSGTIEGKVEYGGRPQPGVTVSLRDADGKEKAATTSDDKGKFKFEKVPVGNYHVFGAKSDSSSGTRGSAPVQVEADKTVKPTIDMTKLKR
jgi:hypothetical protein